MSSTITLKASGLNTSPNQLTVPEGSLTTAENVIIRRDNIVEPRRGMAIYGNEMDAIAQQLFSYKERLLRHFEDVLEFDDGSGTFTAFDGSFEEPITGIRIKSVESNGNFYFTSSEGIKKIAATSGSEFSTSSGYIIPAGGIKALDLQSALNRSPSTGSPWFVNDSVVAYRLVWGVKDVNQNLILGTPSDRSVIYNPYAPVIVQDMLNTLGALDDTSFAASSLLDDGDYVATLGLPSNASPQEIKDNLVSLADKIDNDLYYANDSGSGAPLNIDGGASSGTGSVYTVSFSSGDPTDYMTTGDSVELTGFTITTPGDLDGIYVLTNVTSTTISFASSETAAIATAGDIFSANYRAIAAPSDPSVPATHAQLAALQDYLGAMITRLQLEPTASVAQTYVQNLALTSGYTTNLTFAIPDGVTTNHFFQVYRSNILTATGTDVLNDLTPSDELKLCYEANPTSAEISARIATFEDITPDTFLGANLYINPQSGEGLAGANDIPPWAVDVNRFKNVVFYANTRTRQRYFSNLLGVQTVIDSYDPTTPPSILIEPDGISYTFILGEEQVTSFVVDAPGSITTGGRFHIYSANDATAYSFWYDLTGSDSPPADPGFTLVRIDVSGLTLDTEIAQRTADVINRYPNDFQATVVSTTLTIVNALYGIANDAAIAAGLSGTFAITTTIQGAGEDASSNYVLLSPAISPAQAVEETTRSLIRVINENTNSSINGFYLSGIGDVPGKFYLEKKDISADTFDLLASSIDLGDSFNPSLAPSAEISSISVANPTVVTTATPHGLSSGNQILIAGSNSTPSITGYQTVLVTGANTFTVPVDVTVSGDAGGIKLAGDLEASENEVKPNRIYYSKPQQPESVPIANFFDVGAQDKSILRIFPLRDSLFVFKEDGLYRVSGEGAPWFVQLFDASAVLKATDSLGITNNVIYGWLVQGICSVTETGVSIVSRKIDDQILQKGSINFPNFGTATVGVGYDSDNAYLAFTVGDMNDTLSQICYRYNTLTDSWTVFTYGANCALVNPATDKLVIGNVDTDFLSVERKTFSRLDYADREHTFNINAGTYSGSTIQLTSVDNIEVGDSLVQVQQLTVYQYNALLIRLDHDSFTSPKNYSSSLTISTNGVNLASKLDALINKIATDTGRLAQSGAFSAGTYTALLPTTNTFAAVASNYDDLIDLLNTDPGLSLSNYPEIGSASTFETDVVAVNRNTKVITIRTPLQFVVGPFTIFKAIHSSIVFSPHVFGDVLSYKQISEATAMFGNKAFTAATLSFATDLLPAFEGVDFTGDGNGSFGLSNPFGSNFFGGASNGAPFRTYVPRNKQRCRYLVLKYAHGIAREKYLFYGLTLTGRSGISSRAYR